jgi:GT2 family glycosyltransferase
MTYDNFNIWVLDNGSSDDSVKRLNNAKLRRTRVCVSPKNLGFTTGNNYLVKQVMKELSPEYLLVLNNDTTVAKNLLSLLVKTAKQRDASVVGPSIKNLQNIETAVCANMRKYLLYSSTEKIPSSKDKIFKTDYIHGCCMLIKSADYLSECGFRDEYFIYSEEVDLSFRLVEKGKGLFVNLLAKVKHKEGASFKKERRIPLYFHTRNQFLLRKDHLGFSGLLFFISTYMISKFPKKIAYLIWTSQLNMLKVYLIAVLDGIFNFRKRSLI